MENKVNRYFYSKKLKIIWAKATIQTEEQIPYLTIEKTNIYEECIPIEAIYTLHERRWVESIQTNKIIKIRHFTGEPRATFGGNNVILSEPIQLFIIEDNF